MPTSQPQASLVEYLKRYALRHAEKDLLTRTYLAVDSVAGVARLAGYFSLATVSVERASVIVYPNWIDCRVSQSRAFYLRASQSMPVFRVRGLAATCLRKHWG
ncbi:MAG: hypothetical protein R3F37_15960 [Candidatus Competibacteraceae bacterium]